MPSRAVTIDDSIALKLRPFGINNVSSFAARILNPLLLRLIKMIESWRESIMQITHVSSGVQSTPRFGASLAFAGFQDK
jgi:hypothetical protein